MSCIGDTVLSGQTCKIISKERSTCDQRFSGLQFLFERSDSVFHYNSLSGQFELIINFSANAGDYWNINKFDETEFRDSMRCTIDSVGNIVINGNNLRLQFVTLNPYRNGVLDDLEYFKTTIIENIGFEKALFPPIFTYVCDGNFIGNIRCYEDPIIGFFQFANEECLYTPTEELEVSEEVKVFPNPVGDKLFIETNDQDRIHKIQIVSMSGEVILVSSINKVDTASLNSGIYLLIINSESGVYKKLIVKG